MTRFRNSVWLWVAALLLIAPRVAPAVTQDVAPLRVVSLAPNLTEMVYALGLGEHLAGRSSACDFPPEALTVPIVGGFGRPNWEALWQVRPDIVIATDLEKPGITQQLERRGVRVLILPCEGWADLKAAATAIAGALNQPARATEWNHALDERMHALRERVRADRGEGERPSVYVELWGNPVTTAGGQSFLHQVVELAGGRNVTAGIRGRYPTVSPEWIIRENPDVILLAYMLADMRAAESVKKRIGWSSVDAIRYDRFIDAIPPDLLLRPGPRLIEGAERLAEALSAIMPR